MNGEISREQALNELKLDPYKINEMEYDKAYVLKKIGNDNVEFDECFSKPNKYYFNYPSYMFLLKTFNKFPISGLKKVLSIHPFYFY